MRTKLRKYKQLSNHPRLIQSGHQYWNNARGQWRSFFDDTVDKIVLELACGRGEYCMTLSGLYPRTGYIGVDIRAERMWHGIMFADRHNRHNMLFLRTIIHHLDHFFDPGEIDEIWIIHPDPRPKGADEKRRLTSSRFVSLYARLLAPGGCVKLKTDHQGLYHYSLESFASHGWTCLCQTDDVDVSVYYDHHHGIVTEYESRARMQGLPICYASRSLG